MSVLFNCTTLCDVLNLDSMSLSCSIFSFSFVNHKLHMYWLNIIINILKPSLRRKRTYYIHISISCTVPKYSTLSPLRSIDIAVFDKACLYLYKIVCVNLSKSKLIINYIIITFRVVLWLNSLRWILMYSNELGKINK